MNFYWLDIMKNSVFLVKVHVNTARDYNYLYVYRLYNTELRCIRVYNVLEIV